MAGRLLSWLAEATRRGGSKRAIYSPETTLSRRGVKSRVERRARELAAAGVGAGDVVVVALGNVPDLLLSILACDGLDAVALPLDPTTGDRGLERVAQMIGVTAALRRPKGPDAPPPTFPGHDVRGRRRLPMTPITLDALEPDATRPRPPADARLLHRVAGNEGAEHLLAWSDDDLAAAAARVVPALALDEGRPLLCAGLLTIPLLTMLLLPAWLATGAPLVLSDTLDLATVHPHLAAHPVALGASRSFDPLLRAAAAAGLRPRLDLARVDAGSLPAASAPPIEGELRDILTLEELGLVGVRGSGRRGRWEPAVGLTFTRGAAMERGGQELLVSGAPPARALPALPEDAPGTAADDTGAVHTGFAARFDRSGRPLELLGRDDGLVWIEGRRGCLEAVEQAALTHPEVTWARADLLTPADAPARVELRYGAPGPLVDLRAHLVASLPPHVVPDATLHLDAPP